MYNREYFDKFTTRAKLGVRLGNAWPGGVYMVSLWPCMHEK